MSASISDKLQRAVVCHREGALSAAESLYGEVLAQVPDHFDALHLSGVLQTQLGRHERAAALIRRAIALHPDQLAPYSSLGITLQHLDQLEASLASFDQALRIKADHAPALYNRGNVLR